MPGNAQKKQNKHATGTNIVQFGKTQKKSKNSFTMKSRVISNCRYVYGMLAEKIMELVEYLRFLFRRENGYRSNLVEIYSIKEKYINEEYVRCFLEERKKAVSPDRYRIEIRIDRIPDDEEIIGEVLLMRKEKEIERATLVIKKNIPDEDKLIYWKY